MRRVVAALVRPLSPRARVPVSAASTTSATCPAAWAPLRTLRTYDSKNRLVTVIPGDGVGPEVMESAIGVLQASRAPVDFERVAVKEGVLAADLVGSISRNEVVLKGPLATDAKASSQSRNQLLRNLFALYANVVHVHTVPGVTTRHAGIDLVIIRLNLEGEYTNVEHEIVPGVVQSVKVTTTVRSKQIAEYAFEFAKANGRKKVTAVHKANIQKLTDGLFLASARDVAKNYPEIKYEEMIVDNTAMQLVMNPQQFDVMLTPNLYGTIVTNIAVGLVGGPGLVAGMNQGHRVAMFEPGARHTGSDIAGLNKANPTAMILAATKMLRHIGEGDCAARVERALMAVIQEGRYTTQDIGGSATTKEFTAAVIQKLL